MNFRLRNITWLALFIGLFCVGVWIGTTFSISLARESRLPDSLIIDRNEHATIDDKTIFVGDIMLARNVERLSKATTLDYAFSNLGDLFNAPRVFANFEGSVPAVHVPTPNFTFQFSVDKIFLPVLARAGVTHASLANNHALDYGQAGYMNSLSELEKNGIAAFGHPTTVASSSVAYFKQNGKTVAVIAMAGIFGYPKETVWRPVVEEASQNSDLQIAYIHWGDEYELIHNQTQENFAHDLIDTGVDLIIGHHPHVVEDIERYHNKLIFYSLGNFIFDQYWNNDVRTGLALELLGGANDQWEIKLHPVESITKKSAPAEMDAEASRVFLETLAKQSGPDLEKEIRKGAVLLQL